MSSEKYLLCHNSFNSAAAVTLNMILLLHEYEGVTS